jgi:hypothetical protein
MNIPNSVNVNNSNISVIQVTTLGPQGPQGPAGPPGPSGSEGNVNTSSLVTTSSFNAFTSSYSTGSFTGSFTGSLFGTSSYALTASFILNDGGINTSSFATTGSNTFVGHQTISGSLKVSGSVTADNLWYRYTLTNLPLNVAGQYIIVPITPGYKFVPIQLYAGSGVYLLIGCQIENKLDTPITISNFISVGNTSNNTALFRYEDSNLSANEITNKFGLSNAINMISVDTDPIIVTISGSPSDTDTITVTITGYLTKI